MSHDEQKVRVVNTDGSMAIAFLLAYVGAAVYFVERTHGFWQIILALLKAAVWPAFVIYHVLLLLKI